MARPETGDQSPVVGQQLLQHRFGLNAGVVAVLDFAQFGNLAN
jgi:hypothetical protein